MTAQRAKNYYWQDTKHVAKDLPIGNAKLLKLLDSHGITRKNNAGKRTITEKGKPFSRLRQKGWLYNGNDPSYSVQQCYWVVQLNPRGQQLAAELTQQHIKAQVK